MENYVKGTMRMSGSSLFEGKEIYLPVKNS